jgi:hypothetical protein
METCILVSPMPNLPPCQASVSSTGSAEANSKEQCPEGDFAALLAALEKPPADKAADETCVNVAAGLLVQAGLPQAIQFAVPAGAGGDASSLSVSVPVWGPGNVNVLAVDYEIFGLSGVLSTELLPSFAAVEGKGAAASGAAVMEGPALVTRSVQKDDHAAVAKAGLSNEQPTVGTPTAKMQAGAPVEPKRAAASGAAVMEGPALVTRSVQKDDHAAVAKAGLSNEQPTVGMLTEGKPAVSPEQKKSEPIPAESSTQPSVRPVWPAHEQLHAEVVRRLDAVKSAVLEQVLEKMVFSKSESGEAKVFVRLKPPSLGEVEISLYLEDGRLTGRIVAESAMVRELLDASLSQLRQRLEEQNVHVAELTISTRQEREFRRGRDRSDGMPAILAGRKMNMESASTVPTALPGLLNALA